MITDSEFIHGDIITPLRTPDIGREVNFHFMHHCNIVYVVMDKIKTQITSSLSVASSHLIVSFVSLLNHLSEVFTSERQNEDGCLYF